MQICVSAHRPHTHNTRLVCAHIQKPRVHIIQTHTNTHTCRPRRNGPPIIGITEIYALVASEQACYLCMMLGERGGGGGTLIQLGQRTI